MSIKLKEVSSKRDLKIFIYFPFWLFKSNAFWVPPIIREEKLAFDLRSNPMFLTGDAKLFLVYKDRRIAGRVAVLASKAEIENESKIRFGWLDFENDSEVSALLFKAIDDAASEVNATQIEGPVGLTETDRAGLLIDGFNEENTTSACYNFPYYQRHMEAWGYKKKQDFVEYSLPVPTQIPDEISRLAEGEKEQNALHEVANNTKTELLKNTVSVLDVMNEVGKKQPNFVPLLENQVAFCAEQLCTFLSPKNLLILKNESDEIVAFALFKPSLVKAAKSTNGLLFPFGYLKFKEAMKTNDKAEIVLFYVHHSYQNSKISALLFERMLQNFIASGIKNAASHRIKEEDLETQKLFAACGARQHKRRRVFVKTI